MKLKKKIRALFNKYREIIMYLIFGVMTTAVSFASYYILLFCGVHYLVAEGISWAMAVAFAFFVNKRYVFGDGDNSVRGLLRQIGQFVGVRIGSGILEAALLWLLVEIMSVGEGIAKIPVAVLTVIINYAASKLWIFS